MNALFSPGKLERQKFLRLFFVLIALIALLQCVFSWLIFYFSRSQVEATSERFQSLKVIYELAQSSENLTKTAQTYVITKEPKYRVDYERILAIREGKRPRPKDYEFFYWNLLPAKDVPGNTISLIELAEHLSFTNREFELFSQALNQSNNITIIEITAMNASEGKFDDGSGHFSLRKPPDQALAIRLLFDDAYLEQKRKVFIPIEELTMLVVDRTQTRLDTLNTRMGILMATSRSFSLFAALFMIFVVVKTVRSLSIANKENEMLLLNVFPSSVVTRLKHGEETIADEHQASILFADIVDFTKSTAQLGPTKVVTLLNDLFGMFDRMTDQLGIEKIKTIGDNYMAASGIPLPEADHAAKLAVFALAMKDVLHLFNIQHDLQIAMRIGMDCGTILAGVIGHKKSIYDVWGDVVNTASRMESTGVHNEIQVTEKMAFMLEDKFLLEPREPIEVKGKGLMRTYLLKGKKPNS